MHALRHTEVNVLGYRIDRVRSSYFLPELAGTTIEHEANSDGWHEVLSPENGGLLGRFATRADAERYIIDRELANARVAVERNAA
ncbi:MAG: hypothetical protein ACREPX_10705 [Rhodanobacteraceae bacterium]